MKTASLVSGVLALLFGIGQRTFGSDQRKRVRPLRFSATSCGTMTARPRLTGIKPLPHGIIASRQSCQG